MSKVDKTFNDILHKILLTGADYENKKRETTRKQIPSYEFRHDFKDGFPALSLKKLNFKDVFHELIWFLSGDNDIKYLTENKVNIWTKDAYNWYVKEQAKKGESTVVFSGFKFVGVGSVGRNYSKQWRDFNGTDQIKELIKGMKTDIMSSRLIVNAWNAAELNETALPPCHDKFQIIGVPLDNGKFGFELHWSQRSVDTFLGLPYNIASYALLAKFLETITGFKALAIQGDLKCVHLYGNQIEPAKELLKLNTEEHDNSILDYSFNSITLEDLDNLQKNVTFENIELKNYTSNKAVRVEMLAPKEI